MSQQLLKAKFRGEQVPGSFKKGLNYNLSLRLSNANESFEIITTTKPEITQTYRDIQHFFSNWTDIKPR